MSHTCLAGSSIMFWTSATTDSSQRRLVSERLLRPAPILSSANGLMLDMNEKANTTMGRLPPLQAASETFPCPILSTPTPKLCHWHLLHCSQHDTFSSALARHSAAMRPSSANARCQCLCPWRRRVKRPRMMVHWSRHSWAS